LRSRSCERPPRSGSLLDGLDRRCGLAYVIGRSRLVLACSRSAARWSRCQTDRMQEVLPERR
jgi:hypothetical protein